MFDCTTDTYETLYARWLVKPGALLDWAKYDPERHRLLDLAGGTGAISKEAVRRGAETVHLLDLNPRCTREETHVGGRRRIFMITGRAEDLRAAKEPWNPLEWDECRYPYNWLPDQRTERWDLVVCRQALGYLNLPVVAKALLPLVAPHGRFVFNTFVRPKWSAKTYKHEGRRYFEASGFIGWRVLHLQATDGDFDITSFRWWTDAEVRASFGPGWALEEFKRTESTLWYSWRREPA